MLQWSYDGRMVHDLQQWSAAEVQKAPRIVWSTPSNGKCYALLMVDPDAPNPDFLHWGVTNMDGTTMTTWMPYYPPSPPSGTHHYHFLVLEQPGRLALQPVIRRPGFQTKQWIQDMGGRLVQHNMILVSAA